VHVLCHREVKQVDGAWLQFAVLAGKAIWTGYRYYKSAQTANMAVQAAAHLGAAASVTGATYTAASTFGP
jgi:predicted negative regulator of RcsB-dependent stress response